MNTEDRVIEKIRKRREQGLSKYGVSVDRTDLSLEQWLQHLQEELLDAAIYVERLMSEDHDDSMLLIDMLQFLKKRGPVKQDWRKEYFPESAIETRRAKILELLDNYSDSVYRSTCGLSVRARKTIRWASANHKPSEMASWSKDDWCALRNCGEFTYSEIMRWFEREELR